MARVRFRPHKHQWEALTSKARYVAMICGVQGGKTTCGAVWLVQQVAQDPTANYLVVFPTYPIGKQSTMPKFFEWFPQDWGKWIERDKVFRLKAGGNIWFRSAEKPESIEGITAKAAWIDEAGQISALAWETIQARLSIAKGKGFLTTTPYTMNWLYYDFQKMADEGHPDYHVVQFASNESPYFDDEEYERARKRLDPRRFALKYAGQFTRMDGLVYSGFSRDTHVVKPYVIPKDAQIVIGADYGHTAPSAILWGYKDRDGCLVIFKEFYKTKRTYKQLADVIGLTDYRFCFVDPNPKSFSVELSTTYNLKNIIPADNNVDTGIGRVQSLFNQSGKIKIFSTCRNLISELEMYRYQDDRDGLPTDKVLKKNDHACDALRYMVHTEMARPALAQPSRRSMIIQPEDSEWSYGEDEEDIWLLGRR